VESGLAALGWTGDSVNFGTTAVEVQSIEPFGEGTVDPAGNFVAVTLGDSSEDEDQELGGALIQATWQLFIDVVGVSIPISVALADDCRTLLKNRRIPVKDFSTTSAGVMQDGYWIEFDVVAIEIPPAAAAPDRRTWRVVTCGLNVLMPDDTYTVMFD